MSFRPRLSKLPRLFYALYALLAFLTVGLAALLLVLVIPGLERRRKVVKAAAGFGLRLAGSPVSLHGVENLPAGQCVVVSNHASYLDGPVFTAALPPRFGFVIKREMAAVPLAGLLLHRIGSEFVERVREGRTADARRVMRRAEDGHSLVFFPEGTFGTGPGLLKFHAGAFITAARAGCPVVPAVIHGTRRALPPDGGLPRPQRLRIQLLPAIELQVGPGAATRLQEQARAAILAALGEPDLTAAGEPPCVMLRAHD